MNRLLRKCAITLSLLMAFATTTTPVVAMDVYLFRGLAGIPFSVGLDDLEKKLKTHGIRAETHPHESWQRIYAKIRTRGVREVAFIGHSMGALSAISLTKKLKGSGIRVAYLGLIDIPGSGKSAPKNASWAEAYVSAQPGFGLLRVNARHKNLIVNTRVPKTVHITIDDSDRVHDAIISAVWLAEASVGRAPKTVSAFAAPRKTNKFGLDLMNTASVKKR